MMNRFFQNIRSGARVLRIVLFFSCFSFFSFLLLGVPTTLSAQEQDENQHKAQPTKKKLHILSTIKPIYLLVNGIVGQHATSSLLIPETVNTHHYSFRPSDLRKLSQADAVIRISKNSESFLNPLLPSLLQRDKTIISLDNISGIKWLKIRGHMHAEERAHHDHDGHNQENENENEHQAFTKDYHIWLNANHALLMVDYIAQQLSQLDPVHAKDYASNSEKLKQQIRATNDKAQQNLSIVKTQPYLVFHDGWHYFQETYGLADPHTISLHEGLPPGLKTIYKLRQQIQSEGIHCLIASPNSNKRLIKMLTEDLPMHIAWLNPIGSGVPDESFPAFMAYNARQFAHCLKQ